MGGGPPGFEQGFTCPALLGIPLDSFRISRTGLSPPVAGRSMPFRYPSGYHIEVPHPHPASRVVWALPRSLAATYGIIIYFLILRVLRCFTSPGLALKPYVFRLQCLNITRDRLPHSEISGSKCVCHSPKLIAAYHVLHRLLVPRHPSCALLRLSSKFLASRLKLLALSLCSYQRTEHLRRDEIERP